MPANRSRTLGWRRCLKQVQERQGALEIAVASPDAPGGSSATDLVWRVRLLEQNDRELLVEQPSALGQSVPINTGIELVVVFSIGQNRWMFTTRVLEAAPPGPAIQDSRLMSHEVRTMRLAMPASVERCQRRTHERLDIASHAGLNLPQAEVWPLLDPKSVLLAERACELRAAEGESGGAGHDHDLMIPEVGPKFTATLVNLGGGGVGLRISPRDSQAVARHKLYWMRIPLGRGEEPICATGKLVHTHMESNHETYAGMAFDFSFNPNHQRYVIGQICRHAAQRQASQSIPLPKNLRQVA